MKHHRLHRAQPGFFLLAVLGLLLTTLLAAPLRAQNIRYFVKFGAILGSSTVTGFEGNNGWIEISAYSFSSARQITQTGNTRVAETPEFNGIQCTGTVDGRALPSLLQAGLVGNPQEATLAGVVIGSNRFQFLNIEMTQTLISEIAVQGTDGDNSIITFQLRPGTIALETKYLNGQGTEVSGGITTYNFLTNTP